jgi:predicted Zn-dependent peptidase
MMTGMVAARRIQRFELASELGSGGVGTVYRARDPQLERDVAIKVLNAPAADAAALSPDDTVDLRGPSPVNADDLLGEARMMARLSHPNVLPVYEVGLVDGAVFLVMEHIDGSDLQRWLDEPRTTEAILDAFAQAGRGLAAAHACGIVHRDFKPSNVLLGRDGRVRVADFGLSRLTARGAGGAMVRVDDGRGTPRYMAPELWDGEPATASSDVWAFCQALTEALGDREVSAELRALIARGLADDPAQRCTLAAVLGALTVTPRARRRRWPIAAAATAGVVTAGIAVAATLGGRGEPAPPPPPTDPRAAILAAAGLPPELGEPLAGDPFRVTVHRLSNGLTVIIAPSADRPRVHAVWRFHVGTRDAPGIVDLARLAAARGSERIGTLAYADEKPHLDAIAALYGKRATATDPAERARLDADIDAHTTAAAAFELPDEHASILRELGGGETSGTDDGQVWFDTEVASNRLAVWAELEADRWTHPVVRGFRPLVADALKSTGPVRPLRDAVWRALFGDGAMADLSSPRARQAIAAEPYAEVVALVRDRFVPDAADLVLSGDVDPATAIPMLEHAFAGWAPRPLPAPAPPPPVAAPTADLAVTAPGPAMVVRAWPVPRDETSEPAVGVLYQLVSQLGMADATARGDVTSIGLERVRRDGTGGLVWSAVPAAGKPGAADAAMDRVLAAVRAGQFSDDDLAAVKRGLRTLTLRAATDDGQRMSWITAEPMRAVDWRARVARIAARDRVTRDDVVRVANALLGKPPVVVRTSSGPAPAPLAVAEPPLAVRFASGRGAFARELLARPSVPIQERLLIAGRDYDERATPAGRLVVTTDPASELFELRYRYDVGFAELPGLCAALDSRASDPALHLTMAAHALDWGTGTCGARLLELVVTGLDRELPTAIAVLDRLADTPSDAGWAKALQIQDTRHARSRVDPPWIAGELAQYALYGADNPQRWATQMDMHAWSTATAGAALRTAARSPRIVTYYGPRSIAELQRLVPPRPTGAGAPKVARVTERRASRVVLLDDPTRADDVRVVMDFLVGRIPTDREPAFLTHASYLRADAAMQALGVADLEVHVSWGALHSDPAATEIVFATKPGDAAAAVGRVIAAIDRPIDAAELDRAKAGFDEDQRTDWIPRHAVPGRVAQWRADGLADDPRGPFLRRLATLTPASLEAVRKAVLAAPRVTIVDGHLAGVDRGALAKRGTVDAISIDQLFSAPARPARH